MAKKTDKPSRRSFMLAVAAHAPATGWSAATFEAVQDELGLTAEQTADLYPNGIEGVIEWFSHHIDTLMCDSLAEQDMSAMRIRDRINTAVMTRLTLLSPYREAARRLARDLAHPRRAALAARLVARTVDDMWRAAGDDATGFSYYSKRTILSGVYGSTLLFWFNDQSKDDMRTAVFLSRRIDNVMQAGKLGRRLREGLESLPLPFRR